MTATARQTTRRFVTPSATGFEGDHHDCAHGVRVNEFLSKLVDAATRAFRFSVRERQVLHHVLFGRSADVIARRLGIRDTSVHKHMHRIFAVTKTDSRRRLLDLALRLAAHRSVVAAPRGVATA